MVKLDAEYQERLRELEGKQLEFYQSTSKGYIDAVMAKAQTSDEGQQQLELLGRQLGISAQEAQWNLMQGNEQVLYQVFQNAVANVASVHGGTNEELIQRYANDYNGCLC